jgi:hypothetical protein
MVDHAMVDAVYDAEAYRSPELKESTWWLEVKHRKTYPWPHLIGLQPRILNLVCLLVTSQGSPEPRIGSRRRGERGRIPPLRPLEVTGKSDPTAPASRREVGVEMDGASIFRWGDKETGGEGR